MELKGYLGKEIQRGSITVRTLYFTCPQHGKDCSMLCQSITVTDGPHTSIALYDGDSPNPVWNYKIENGMIEVIPSINCQGACSYHAYYKFKQVFSKDEL